jgi:hypothetical protein
VHSKPLIRPINIKYDGLDAERHYIDGTQLACSIAGVTKLYNSIAHVAFHGGVAHPSTFHMRFYVGPIAPGSITYALYLFLVHGTLPIYPEIFSEFAEMAMPGLVKAVFARRSGQTKQVDQAVEMIREMAERADDFARMVHKDHLTEKSRLYDLVEKLTDSNRGSMKDMVAPIGRSATEITHFSRTPEEIRVDEPMAVAFRSKKEVMIGDQTAFVAKIVAVDTKTGHCKIEIDGYDSPISGKITDPALEQPGNSYTHALDTQQTVTLTAKPVFRNEEIATLYISDAR